MARLSKVESEIKQKAILEILEEKGTLQFLEML